VKSFMKKIIGVLILVSASSFAGFANSQNDSKPFHSQSVPTHVVGGLFSFSQATARFFVVKYRQISSRVASNRPATASVVRLGPPTTFLKRGLNKEEVVMLLGDPQEQSEAWQGNSRISTFVFSRSGGRVLVAEFKNDVLVAYRIQPAGSLAAN
jgi:hypothetical protein